MKKKISLLLILGTVFLNILSAQNTSGWFTVKEVSKNVWQIDDNKAVNIYLIIGTDSALVVDTGMGSADLITQLRRMTKKPLIIVNTHGHPDHTGANYQFPKVYIHPADMQAAKESNTPERRATAAQSMLKGAKPSKSDSYIGPNYETKLCPIHEGYVFKLGGRRIEVIEAPGHTAGEICLLDIENKLLFAGDNSNALVWLFLPNCKPLHEYLTTLEKLAKRISEFTVIFPGHGTPVPSDFLNDQVACVKGILNKSLESKPYQSFAGNANK
jgi:glyoxylase-like metal-dependent hydrolase (beta-lactamase superfamily II)